MPEPGIQHVVLIPTLVERPLIHTIDHHDVRFICYPVADESVAGDPDAPPERLVRLGKAIGDERRLRILRRLAEGNWTLQELADHFGIPKTTILHHLIVLRSSGLVALRGGSDKRYRLRPEVIPEVSELLHAFVESKKST